MNKLLQILQEMNPTVNYAAETALIDDGILDSMDVVSLVAELDDQFDVQVSAEDLIPENFNSAAAIYALIQRLKKQ